MKEGRKTPGWVGPAVEYGPLVAFFLAYLAKGLMAATAVVMVATVAALVLGWLMTRKLPKLPLITAPIVLVLGGLTLWSENDTFIKMRPTIVNVLLSALLIGGYMLKKQPLKFVLSSALPMTNEGWNRLTIRFGVFFLALAVANEVIWRTQSTDFWVTYKVFGVMALTVLFSMTQVPLMMKHQISDDAASRDSAETERS